MNQKAVAVTFAIVLFVLWFAKSILARAYHDLRIIFSVVWFILLAAFIVWLETKTDFFKKLPFKERVEHRTKVMHELGLLDVVKLVGYICCILIILMFFVFGALGPSLGLMKPAPGDNPYGGINLFIFFTILSLVLMVIIHFSIKSVKKKLGLL